MKEKYHIDDCHRHPTSDDFDYTIINSIVDVICSSAHITAERFVRFECKFFDDSLDKFKDEMMIMMLLI